jgi:6-phosphogluconolactonase
MNLRIFDSIDDLLKAAARMVVEKANATDKPVIALSGGSTPKPLYKMLGQSPYKEELAKKPVTWVVVDERVVPLDNPQSNAGMINQTLFANGTSPGHRFLRFKSELEDPAKIAKEFEREWESMGIKQIDLILLGMGDDGHTASLFPDTPVLKVKDRIASEVFVPRMDSWRVTLTMPIIRQAKVRAVLAAGASKEPIIRAIKDGADYPIAGATGGNIETWWLLDRAAAGELQELK